MVKNIENGWQIEIEDPVKGRMEKPRNRGLTMVLDKGLGLEALRDLLAVSGKYIDFIKFSFGTSFVLPSQVLEKKIELVRGQGIGVYPGGTLFEVAASQKRINEYLFRAKQLGFNVLEVSNGTLSMTSKLRREVIMKAKSMGFKVLTEVGKKDRKHPLSLSQMVDQIEEDMASGAYKIIIEGRESGKGISIYNDDGSINISMFEGILQAVRGKEEVIIWEAPLKKQQVKLIKELGPNVNIGNINPAEIIALETLRRGLRGDTFGYILKNDKEEEGLVGA